jgi:hypothetical protein
MLKAKTLVIPLVIAACATALIIYGSTLHAESDAPSGTHPEYVKTRTVPSGYLEVSVSPPGISANAGEHIEIRCAIYSLVNTPVEITSVELVVFDFDESLLREQAMTKDSYWSAHSSYTIAGDEACYRLKVNFTTPYADPGEYSEYTADSFPIAVN